MINPLSRRHFLYGSGVAMLLPHLESLAKNTLTPPKRFLALYVGHGFAIILTDPLL